MKKITGKVVSLVLALALVVSSFSVSFAQASTKTMSGVITDTNEDAIYLVNGGAVTTANLTDFLLSRGSNFKFETVDHHTVTDEKINAISHISGDKLVSLSVNSSTDVATLKLKSSSASGKEVISVLYEGSYTDEDGNDYTVKARRDLTVYVYDKDQIVYGEYDPNYATKDSGTGFDDFETFAQTANSTKTLGIYRVVPAATSALATYLPADLTTATSGITDKNAYSFSITGTDVHVSVVNATSTFTQFPVATIGKSFEIDKYTKDASTGNVTVTVKKLVASGSTYKASTDSDDKYTLKTKIEKKCDVATVLPGSTAFSISKTDGKSVLTGDATSASAVVTDCEVVFPAGTTSVSVNENTNVKKISGTVGTLTIGDANVGSIDIDNGTVNVTDGKVGNITTDGAPVAAGDDSVLVSGGKVGNIDVTDVDNDTDSNVTVNAGTVGTIDADGTVTVAATDADTPVVTGKITAPTISLFSDEAKVTVAGVKASADGTITFLGNDTNVSAIDFDYRETTLNLGDEDNAFTGKIPAPTNAENGKIDTTNEDTNATVSGTVKIDTISLDSDTNLAFDGAVTAETIEGDGAMKIAAGKLYVSSSASGVTLKLSDKTLVPGTVVFKADADAVDVDSFDTYGFTLTKSAGSAVDTFKIDALSFAGIAINKDASSIAKGYSETFTASAYPGGTSLPSGCTIQWTLDGGSSDVFTLTSSGNTATVKVNSIDSTFASENKTTLTATLYDEDGYELDDYAPAKCEITAIEVPEAVSDTNADMSISKGASYQMKVTSATVPVVTAGTGGVVSIALVSKNGNDYFYKFTANGSVGAATGIYLNGKKIFVATVKAPAFTSDTTMNLTVKGAYQFQITSAEAPTVCVGSAAFKLNLVSKNGNNYFYKITSDSAKGTQAGIYVNGTRIFVATVG
ncbi:hypothetical protein [Caproiciproducens galactitolivorans]|uniref:hypothetical protein n=1 Tax=Caproiciproducens galactitolivorans TaxID=642589 RepID=UPI00240931D4|nr:hypothetical protein [Caproiciproducens galactitolivorans]